MSAGVCVCGCVSKRGSPADCVCVFCEDAGSQPPLNFSTTTTKTATVARRGRRRPYAPTLPHRVSKFNFLSALARTHASTHARLSADTHTHTHTHTPNAQIHFINSTRLERILFFINIPCHETSNKLETAQNAARNIRLK